MENPRPRASWAPLALAVLVGATATLMLGAAAWQGLKIETSVPLDLTKARSEIVLDIPPSAFAFEPVIVSVTDKPKKARKVVEMRFRSKNGSDRDYYVYATALLVDAEDKPVATQSTRKKLDDNKSGRYEVKFELPYPALDRVKTCKLKFAFEKE